MPKYEPDLDRYELSLAEEQLSYESGDEYGGQVTTFSLLGAPGKWSDRRIKAAVDELFPYERCHHAHDCCGHYYRRETKVVSISAAQRGGEVVKLVLVRTFAVQNL